jgi:hypothetical protein
MPLLFWQVADQERLGETMTHESILRGTTTLFAALSVLDGTVICQCMARFGIYPLFEP